MTLDVNSLVKGVQRVLPQVRIPTGGNGGGSVPPKPCELISMLADALNSAGGNSSESRRFAAAAKQIAFVKPLKLVCNDTTDTTDADEGKFWIDPLPAAGVDVVGTLANIDELLPGFLQLVGPRVHPPNTALSWKFKLNDGDFKDLKGVAFPFVGHVRPKIKEVDDWPASDDRLTGADIGTTPTGPGHVTLKGDGGKYTFHYFIQPLMGQHGLLNEVFNCP